MTLYTKAANDVFAGHNADGSARPVDNQEAQVWGTEIESSISAADAHVDALSSAVTTQGVRITAIEAGQSGSLIAASTWSALSAMSGSFSGQAAEVPSTDTGTHVDPVVGGTKANAGRYSWSVSPAGWRWISADALSSKASINGLGRRTNGRLAFSRDVILDFANFHGGGSAVYVPMTGFFGNSVDGVIFSLALTESTELVGYHKVSVAQSSNLIVIYYDAVEGAIKTATYPTLAPIDPDRYHHIATLHGYGGVATGNAGVVSDHRITSTREIGASLVAADRPAIYDRAAGKLYLPILRGYHAFVGTWSAEPEASAAYREVTVPTSGESWQVYIDLADIVANGATSNTAIHVLQGFASNAPVNRAGNARLILLGTGYQQGFSPVAALRMGVLAPNQFGCGREDNDLADIRYLESAPVDLVEAASVALGFTRGYANSVNNQAYYGGMFPREHNSGVVTGRFFLESAADGSFGTPRFYLFQRDKTAPLSYFNGESFVSVAKEHSARVREYRFSARLSAGTWFYGLQAGSHGGGAAIKVFGLQYAISEHSDPVISPLDYPMRAGLPDSGVGGPASGLETTPSGRECYPVFGKEICIPPDRALPIYVPQLAKRPGDYGNVVATVLSAGSQGQKVVTDDCQIDLDAAWLGTTMDLVVRPAGNPVIAHHLNVAVKKGAMPGKALKVMMIGDSISNRQMAYLVNQLLVAWGYTPTWLGTLNGSASSSDLANASGPLGEAREGWAFSDFLYSAIDADVSSVLNLSNSSSVAAYLASAKAAKRVVQVFLRPATGGDAPSVIHNGYVFDFNAYRTAFSMAAPDVVLLGVGMNDVLEESPSQTMSQIETLLPQMLASIRTSCSSAKIGSWFIPTTKANATGGGIRAPEAGAVAAKIRDVVYAMGDANMHIIPAWTSMNAEFAFASAGSPDANGVSVLNVSDVVHPVGAGRQQLALSLASYVAAHA